MLKKRTIRIIRIVFVISLVLSGCNIFTTRSAEPPVNVDIKWNDFPVEPHNIVDNLVLAYQNSKNASQYPEILDTDFKFYFDNKDINDYGTPSSWNYSTEKSVPIRIHNSGNIDSIKIELEEIEEEQDVIQTYSADIYRYYNLTMYLSPDDSILVFCGKMHLLLKEVNSFWHISKWFDSRDYKETTNSKSWGWLKNEYSTQSIQ